MMATRLPVYLTIRDVQQAMRSLTDDPVANENDRRCKARWLASMGLLVKRGRRLLAPLELLRTELPEVVSRYAEDAYSLVEIGRRRR